MMPIRSFVFFAAVVSATTACGPGRTAFARYPGGGPAFDRNASDPKAVAVADAVIVAAGGSERWAKAKQVKWSETISHDGKPVVEGEEGWDRWNGRHYGRMRREDGDLVIMRMLYEDDATVFVDRNRSLVKLPPEDSRRALPTAVERFQFDTAVLCMPFLLEEPGTTLAYIGEVPDEAGSPTLESIKVTFDPKDIARGGAIYEVAVHKDTHLIERIAIVKPGGNIAYRLSQWVDVGGLKFPTVENNLGLASEVITFKDITTGEPDETLYSPPIR